MILFSCLLHSSKKITRQTYLYLSLVFLIIDPLRANGADASSSSNYYLNFVDNFYQNSNLFLYVNDEWGFKGTYSLYGLPATAFVLEYNQLPVKDPLYGNIPFAWHPYHTKTFRNSGTINTMNIQPRWYDDEQIHSKFNNYRGDYGFSLFDIFINGKMPGKISWSFYGQKLSYDGWLGINAAQLGVNLSQTYQLDFQIPSGDWNHVSGMTYQKYTPGVVAAQLEGLVEDLQYLSWIRIGDYTEIRVNGYYRANRITEQDSSSIGFSFDNFLYRLHNLDLNNALDGEAAQLMGELSHNHHFKNLTLQIQLKPLRQIMFFKHADAQERLLWQPAIGLELQRKQTYYAVQLGSAGEQFTGQLNFRKKFRPFLGLSIAVQRDYSLYPYLYYSKLIDNSASRVDRGFTFTLFSSCFKYSKKSINIEIGLHSASSNFRIPTQTQVSDTTFELTSVSLNSIYLTNRFSLSTSWGSELAVNLIIAPQDEDYAPRIQGWGRVGQRLDLFNNNLHLYAAAELAYLHGTQGIMWFEKLRDYGRIKGEFFTNERLQVNLRAGARVGRFRIFYVIYNAEGRQFSSLAGMPYRSRLKLFGVEWSFLN